MPSDKQRRELILDAIEKLPLGDVKRMQFDGKLQAFTAERTQNRSQHAQITERRRAAAEIDRLQTGARCRTLRADFSGQATDIGITVGLRNACTRIQSAVAALRPAKREMDVKIVRQYGKASSASVRGQGAPRETRRGQSVRRPQSPRSASPSASGARGRR